MKGWSKKVNRGKSGARKRQQAAGDHSASKVKQKRGPEAKKSSLGFAGVKTVGLGDKRPVRDNIGGVIKAPRKGDM
jgi:hypothetical protein